MDTWKCLVCSVPITATSMGLDVCRACAAFFKRTMQAGRTYSCRFRRLRNQCTFRKDEKFMCRSCRFDRCVELGMEYTEPRKNKTKKEREEEARELQEMLPSITNIFPSTPPSRRESILGRMKDAYKASHKRRLVQEHRFIAASELYDMGHPTKEIYLINITQYYEVLRIRMQESSLILGNVFDEFDNISSSHRTTLLRNFIGRFCFTEGLFLSSRYFKDRFYFSFMTSLLTCMDPSNVDQWVTEGHEIERKDELRTSMKGFTEEYNELMAPMLKMSELTETELYALLVLAYCDLNPDLPLPEDVMEKAEETRLKVFEELQDYYRNELRLSNYSERLGNLMTVVHEAGEAGVKVNEEMRMYATMFNLYPDDDLFREVFLD